MRKPGEVSLHNGSVAMWLRVDEAWPTNLTRAYMAPMQEAVVTLCVEKFEAFRTAGQAQRIKATRLCKMASASFL